MLASRGTVRDDMSTDTTDSPTQYCMRASAIHGSLAAGNGHTSISSSESLHGPLPHTKTLGESDIKENCPAVRGVQKRHYQVIYVNGRQDERWSRPQNENYFILDTGNKF